MKQYRYVNHLTRRNRMARMLWGLCYILLFRPTPRWALNGWRCMLLRLFGAEVGTGCRIHPNVRIWAPWNLSLGAYVALAEGVDVYCVSRITIASKVTVSQRSFLCTASHETTSLTRPLIHAPITMGDHVWIAAEAMIHPGVTVNVGAIVGARAVIRRDVPAWTVWAGNPAREVGKRRIDGSSRNSSPEQQHEQ